MPETFAGVFHTDIAVQIGDINDVRNHLANDAVLRPATEERLRFLHALALAKWTWPVLG